MTFWWSDDNYGQLLQCYALQKFLRDLGHEAFLIKYRPDNKVVQEPLIKKIYKALNPKKLYNFAKNRINRKKLEIERKNNDRQFELFRQKYIVQSEYTYSTLKELQDNPPEADAYIVGSDQVWNFNFIIGSTLNRNRVRAYFLDFGNENIKRLAIAASWGRSDILDEEIAEIAPLLQKFDYVSVREKNGIFLCKKCGYNDGEWIADPTLLLSAEIYRSLYNDNKIKKHKKNFLLLYMLNNECAFDVKLVYDFAETKKIDVVYVTGNGRYDSYTKSFATIPEWLYLVDNADYVITNSFHCGFFSSIFHKKFGIVPLTGSASRMNNRIDSLFDLLGIKKRYVYPNDFSVLDNEYNIKIIDNQTIHSVLLKLFH